MRIAILGCRGYPSTYGGFETFVRVLAPALTAAGHTVIVYGRDGHGVHRPADIDGISVVRTLGVDSKSLSTLSYGLSGSVDVAIRRPDVALVVNVANGYFLPLLHAARVPTLVNVDGLEWRRDKWGKLAKCVFRTGAKLTARWATLLVADSREIAAVWRREFSVEPAFIPYGAPVLTTRSLDRITALGLEPESYVLVVARFAPENHIELTLDALELLSPRPKAVVVGSGNYVSPLDSRLRELVAKTDTLWLGHVSDQELLSDLWFHAGVYVHGHSVGGTNPALLQALGAGAPTLAYPSPFNREVVVDTALICPDTAPRLAESLTLVLQSPGLRAEMRRLGQARVASAYQWETVCDAYLQELQKLGS